MRYIARTLEVILYATAVFSIVCDLSFLPAHAQAAECELTQADAMVHLNKAAEELPATVTVIAGAEASDFISRMNTLQTTTVFVGDTIAIIALTNKDVVQVTVFKEGCRTYQSRSLTHEEWMAIVQAVSATPT